MPTTVGLKALLDLPEWRPLANAPNASAAGCALVGDKRPSEDRHPELFQLASNTVLNKYAVKGDDWVPLASPALAGTFGAGACAVFVPEAGPAGTLAAGATTTTVVLSTVLPAAVGTNQLANRGDGRGFKVRLVGNAAGGSGKTEERLIVANTSGTQPTLTLDSALSFTPAAGDRYEFLSGAVLLLGAGTTAAGTWRRYDVATNSYASLATTNLPATIGTDSALLSLSELYVPTDRAPGEGLLVTTGVTYNGGALKCLQASATAAGTLTGASGAADASLVANEFRNFQLRVVEDTGTPTAVGQRRKIASHTGANPTVYTLASNWTVTPSATAKYVLEAYGDSVLLWTSASTTTFNYSLSGNAWDTTTWAAKTAAVGAGVGVARAWGVARTPSDNARQSYVTVLRGGASNALDVFDLAGAATGAWTENVTYGNKSQTFTTGTSLVYDPVGNGGRYAYVSVNGTQRFARLDLKNAHLEPYAWLEYPQGTAVVGEGLAWTLFVDGTTRIPFLVHLQRTGANVFQVVAQEF